MLLDILYNIFVMPIEMLVCFTYELMKAIFCNAGIAIIAVSMVIQTLLLPFYKKADELQEEENQKQKQMSKWVKHIRKTFKGDERMMMLSTYYRQQNYSVFQALNGSLSLLLQVPFFIAAYHFLSVSAKLERISFLFIKDLGMADRLVHIGGVAINILPILMTLVNIISAVVYTSDKSVRNKVQTFGLALVFLVLLYNSPSGLVLYWLMNNLYSLGKNIVMKNKDFFASLFKSKRSKEVKKTSAEYDKDSVGYYINKMDISDKDYWRMAALATLLLGAVIPLNIFASSPMEFITSEFGPGYLVANSLSTYIGIFFLWGGIIFKNMKKMGKGTTLIVLCGLAFSAMANYVFFGDTKGEVSALLISSDYGAHQKALARNSYVCYGVFVAACLIYMFLKKYADVLIRIVVISFCILSIWNGVSMANELRGLDRTSLETETVISPIIPVSKSGKNVMVIMMDRAISGYLPYIFEERPDVAKAFDGFVYYPNTISFGGFTNYGTPPLFGGYEYTPDEMNKRDDMMLIDKHNQALLMMPKLFSKEGFEITVCDPPYVNYAWIPDLNLYNGIPNTTAYITEGRYLQSTVSDRELAAIEYKSVLRHNTIFYPFVKTTPLMVQAFLSPSTCSLIQNVSANNSPFAKCFSVLQNLKALTKVEENGDTLLVFQNSSTHEPMMLDLPDYTFPDGSMGFEQRKMLQPKIEINGEKVKFDNDDQMAHYHANMVTYIELGKWFDYLREIGVYDNTRIILVSDHGRDLRQFDSMKMNEDIDLQKYTSLFMVKDFGAEGFEISDEFMTIADVPTWATKDVIENPVNPFTGNPINNDEKYAHPQLITTSDNFVVNVKRYSFETSGSNWYSVHDNIFDANNWKQVEYQQRER